MAMLVAPSFPEVDVARLLKICIIHDLGEALGGDIPAPEQARLAKEGITDLFYIMGGPMLLAEATCIKEGIRMIDVRHEQAAAFACQAYSRLKQVPSVCMAASGPGVTNLVTGLANALIDCCPVVAFGGASPLSQFGRQVFQEIDQVELMRGCTKHVDRLINLTLPRIRDFRGISPKSFDGRGNYSIGIREQLIFPEIEYDQIDQIRGMDISIITTADNDEAGRALLKEMGMPFRAS